MVSKHIYHNLLKRRKWIQAAFAFFILFPSNATAEEKLRAIACNFEPYYGESMKNQGPVSEITCRAFQAIGYAVDIKFVPWARALLEAEQGDHDVIVGLWYSTERAKWIAFSDVVLENELGFYKKKGDPIIFTDYAALKAQRTKIGIVRGYVNPEGFDEAQMVVEMVKDDILNMRKLAYDRIQLVMIDKQVGAYMVRTHMPNYINSIEWLVTLQKQPMLTGIVKNSKTDWQKRLADFNKGLGMIKQNGTLEKILKEHGF